MAISATLIQQSVVSAASVTSAGVTPTDGVLYILGSVSSGSDFGNTATVLTSSGSPTMTSIASSALWGSRRQSQLWRVTGWASGNTFTVSNSGGGDQSSGIVIVQVTGLDSTPDSGVASGSFSAQTSNNRSPGTTPGAGDATLAFIVIENNGALGQDGGWSELADSGEANGVRRMGAAWDADADTTPSWTFSSSDGWSVTLTLEAGAAGATDLVIADLTVAVVADAVALTQVHQLAVADATVSVFADTVVLTQVHELAVADLAIEVDADTVALTQVHELTVADATVVVTADTVTLTQVHELAVADLTVEVTADTVTLTTEATLDVSDLTVAVASDTVTLTQVHELVVADLTVAVASDTVSLTQEHQLVVADLTVAVTMDAVTLEVAGDLVVADLTVVVTADTISLTQVHELAVADLTVEVTAETVTLTQGSDLVIADLTVEPVVDTVALTQDHQLTIADLTVQPVIDVVTLTQDHQLVVADMTVSVAMDSVTLVLPLDSVRVFITSITIDTPTASATVAVPRVGVALL